jgi:hypothetical protein
MEKEYKKKIKKLEKLEKENDRECWHIERDKILEKFFTDMFLNKIKTKKEIKNITNEIYINLIDNDMELWYS